jgi:hypothetical protein
MQFIPTKTLSSLFAALCLAGILSSCFKFEKEIDKVNETAKQAVATLDKAINGLQSESVNWRQVLEETRDELVDETQSTIKNEVNNLIGNGIAAAGGEIRCNSDFIRNRMRQELIHVRNGVAQKVGVPLLPENILEPGVCQVTPTSIDLSLEPVRRNEIKLAGYDFDKENITVKLLNEDQEIDVTSELAQTSKYLLTLNLSPTRGVPFSDKSDKIIVRVAKTGKLLSEINVIQPPPSIPKPDTSQFITNLQVISEGSDDNRCPSSMMWNSQDLNQGAGGDYIYLCYSKGGTTQPLTDLQVTSSGGAGNQCGGGWEWYPQDLNKGAGGDYIHLCSRRDGQLPIKDIMFTSNPNPGNLCPSGWNWIDKDLNKATEKSGDPYIYLCYLK